MGLGEKQVFQDEKSRLANTTVARIVAAKGSLNDPTLPDALADPDEPIEIPPDEPLQADERVALGRPMNRRRAVSLPRGSAH